MSPLVQKDVPLMMVTLFNLYMVKKIMTMNVAL